MNPVTLIIILYLSLMAIYFCVSFVIFITTAEKNDMVRPSLLEVLRGGR